MCSQHEDVEPPFDQSYKALGNITETWVIVAHGAIAFRFGPYTSVEAGKIMREAVERNVAIAIVSNCGPEFDWDMAVAMATVLGRDAKDKAEPPADIAPTLSTSGAGGPVLTALAPLADSMKWLHEGDLKKSRAATSLASIELVKMAS